MQIAFAAPQGTPGPAPLVRTLLTAAQVYGRDGGQAGALRVAAALHLAAATSGPVGPHSMEAARLAQALEQEDVGWQAYCAQLGTADLNQQVGRTQDALMARDPFCRDNLADAARAPISRIRLP